MKRVIKDMIKKMKIPVKVFFKKHDEFGKHGNIPACLHMRLIDLEYDLENLSNDVERDEWENVVFYLEPKSYYDTRDRLENKKHVWTKGEIDGLRKQLGMCSNWSDSAKDEIKIDYFKDNHNYNFAITKWQSEMGLEYLKSITFKKNGEMRQSKSCFLGDFEANILKKFKEFRFIGLHFYHVSNYQENSAPIYRCIDKKGHYFDYIGIGGSWYQFSNEAMIINRYVA